VEIRSKLCSDSDGPGAAFYDAARIEGEPDQSRELRRARPKSLPARLANSSEEGGKSSFGAVANFDTLRGMAPAARSSPYHVGRKWIRVNRPCDLPAPFKPGTRPMDKAINFNSDALVYGDGRAIYMLSCHRQTAAYPRPFVMRKERRALLISGAGSLEAVTWASASRGIRGRSDGLASGLLSGLSPFVVFICLDGDFQ